MDIDNLSSPFGSISISVPERVTDIDDHDDLFFSPEYAQDIIDYMQARENHYTLSENFLDDNPEVTSQMRSILVDWLIQVQSYEQLEDETAQLTVALVDQYLARAPVPLLRLQLLGITCVFIAAKYIERFPPLVSYLAQVRQRSCSRQVENLCALTAGTYVAEEVLAMEHKVLKCLMFDVSMPLPNFFLARYFRVHLHDVKIKNLACYLIDLSLPSVHVVPVAPSLLAASALCLTRKLLLPQEAECWTPALAFYSKYSEKDLLQTVKLLAKILLRAPDSKYQGARSKHSDPSRLGVSMEPFLIGHPVLLQLTSEK
ncbi:G2/mitotic-specific cyclin-B-like [Pomacea canaliculata]|uniref:G2/mitotic-specific cyclin-B-like n=1 Tax=Pomacea canaliculata TaxID=400727 RepID=UPI000D73EEEC|nr:G2/mitotic-specific cyclin-B-like [Pomacea canaliculata]